MRKSVSSWRSVHSAYSMAGCGPHQDTLPLSLAQIKKPSGSFQKLKTSLKMEDLLLLKICFNMLILKRIPKQYFEQQQLC